MPMGVVSNSDWDDEFSLVKGVKGDPKIHEWVRPINPRVPINPDRDRDTSSDSEITSEINSEIEKRVNSEINSEHGRRLGDNNVPESLRKLIGEESVIHGRASALELAKSFGISPSSVSAYAKGATSTASYHQPDSEIANYIKMRKTRVTKRALRTLSSALTNITDDKLTGASVKDCAAIAKDMSAIIKNFEPKSLDDSAVSYQQNQFVFYSPNISTETQYEVIDATKEE